MSSNLHADSNSTVPHVKLSPRTHTALKWTGIAAAGILIVVVLFLALIDWNRLKGPIERMASASSGRTVKIEGPLEAHIWSLTPRASLEGLVVGSPPWEANRPMLRIEKLDVQLKLLPLLKGDVILPRLELLRPEIYLHRDGRGRANWTFESTQPSNARAEKPPQLPVVREFLVHNGKLTVRDELLKLKIDGTLQAHESSTAKEPFAFHVQGKGTINEKPFDLSVGGGPLINLDPDQPYPFKLLVNAGDIHVESDGAVKKPFDLGRFNLTVNAKGGDLADLYYLTQIALPNTPPFQLSAHIDRNAKTIKVTEIAGQVGQSDLTGELTVDASRKRPSINGDLHSRKLRLADLAATLGGKPTTPGSLQGESEKSKPAKKGVKVTTPSDPNARLFPTARLQVNRVRAMDADVRFQAQSIEAGSLPLEKVSFHIQLDEGQLALAPFEFEMPQGQLSGTAHIDVRGEIPQTKVDIRVRDVELEQLKGKKPGAQPPLAGVMQAHAVIEGQGDSIHDLMAGANGRLSLVLPHGQVNAALAELTGINVARGLGLLLAGNDEKAEIRCGVAQFDIKDGTMHANNVVFDTHDVRITGRGEVRFGPEELDLAIKGEPKELRIARVRTPVEINGHLRAPTIGVDAGKTVKQAAIATALGAALTPVAAIIAFIDPGLAKDENCAALLAEAQPGS